MNVCMKLFLVGMLCFPPVALSNIVSNSDLKKWGVDPIDVSGFDEGYMPERDGPFGDETPNYWIEYYERGQTIVFAYGYGWGELDHEYVFPVRRGNNQSQHCGQDKAGCFGLVDVTSDTEVGYGRCVNKSDGSRESCILTIFDNGDEQTVELKVGFTKKNEEYWASSLIITESYEDDKYPSSTFGQ